MRRIVVSEFVTLDGVAEEPGKWSFPFWSEESAKFKEHELLATDALLLGRLTYEGFAAAWPTMKDTGEFGERMNSIKKYVVSRTLKNPTWNNTTVITADPRLGLADPGAAGRAIQGIVGGIGFLGAGVILHEARNNRVRNLTTAATIWMSAALGIACGLGAWRMGSVAAILVLIVLTLGLKIDRALFGRLGPDDLTGDDRGPNDREPSDRSPLRGPPSSSGQG